MELLLSLLEPINIAIVILGFVVWGATIKFNRDFSKIEADVHRVNRSTASGEKLDKRTRTIVSSSSDTKDVNAMDKSRKKYNEVCEKYTSWVQSISLFPLGGLLGTIIGLMPGLKELNNSGNIDVLYNSLSVALTSTFWGLIASIGLKLYVNFKPDKTSNTIENELAEYDRKLDYLDKFNITTDSER